MMSTGQNPLVVLFIAAVVLVGLGVVMYHLGNRR